MMDRYEQDVIVLDLNERVGWKFIAMAREAYLELARLQEAHRVKFDDHFQKIIPAVDELTSLWMNEEKDREKFILPQTLKDDYHFAKKRFNRMKGSPDDFHKEDQDKRKALEKEKIELAAKIKSYEIEFAREEDEVRHDVNSERIQINSELAVLNYKKKKYEAKTSSLTSCFTCSKKNPNKLAEVTAKIKELEAQLRKLGPIQSKSLAEKRYQMELLHKRRWDVDKALNAHDDTGLTRVKRWQNAIDNAEVVLIVRRMDIDDAINRHYASVSMQVIHAMLNVFALIKICAAQTGNSAPDIEEEVKELTKLAEILHCVEIANRTVLTLYKKMQILQADDRNQIINHKTVKGRLPEALVKTFSVKNFRDQAGTLGLYRRMIDSNHSERLMTETATVTNVKKP